MAMVPESECKIPILIVGGALAFSAEAAARLALAGAASERLQPLTEAPSAMEVLTT